MGKKTQRQPGGCEFDNAAAIAEQSRRMAGIGVAEGAKFLVVAADECRAGVNPARCFHQSTIELKTKRNHSFGFVYVGTGEKLGPDSPKDILRGRKHELIVLAAAGKIEQAKQYTFGTDE